MNLNILKIILIATSFLPVQLFSQSEAGYKLLALGGVFSPSDDEIRNIYGDALLGKVELAAPLSPFSRLRLGANVFSRNGDPFYQSGDFNAGDVADLTLKGVSLSLETNPFRKNKTQVQLYFGAGVDYVFANEEILGRETGDGSAIGAHISVTPEFPLSQRVSFVAEASYRWLEITFKSGRNRYKFNLSGASLLIGLALRL
ncbi:MAG: hypothetical protein ACE5IR_14940 [bacterium]